MSKIVLLTGATGFVGRQVLCALKDMGFRVRLVVRDGKQSEFLNIAYIETVIITKDLFSESENWFSNACRNIDTVIHVAWYAEPGEYLHSTKNLDCLIGTLQLAKGASQAGVRRFIGVGTCFEYDLSVGILTVTTPLRPLTPYAGAKAAAFLALSQCLSAQGVDFAWCRLFYLYGEGEDERRLVPYLHKKLKLLEPAELTSGRQVRDYLDVKEAGRAIAEVVNAELIGAINICSGIPLTVRQLAERIASDYGRLDLLKFGVRQDNLIDPPYVVGVKNQTMVSTS
jgi:dTDP-6-deoxy-L-talose 4-dehydrogenase (NAD+)